MKNRLFQMFPRTVVRAFLFALTVAGCAAQEDESSEELEVVAQELTLPTASATCPTFIDGTMTFRGQSVRVWKGAQKKGGSVVVYWHGTGSSPAEAVSGLGQAAIDEITAAGGIVVAPLNSTGTGTNTGNGTWYTGDFGIADEIVACAISKLQVDKKRIYTMGYSSGGLQATYMGYVRSGYIASVVAYSGGLVASVPTLQDPNETPSILAVHGAPGSDVLIVDFAVASQKWQQDIKNRAGLAVDCNHGGGHLYALSTFAANSWRFLKAHPYDVSPEPYAAGLPAGYPSYCRVVR